MTNPKAIVLIVFAMLLIVAYLAIGAEPEDPRLKPIIEEMASIEKDAQINRLTIENATMRQQILERRYNELLAQRKVIVDEKAPKEKPTK